MREKKRQIKDDQQFSAYAGGVCVLLAAGSLAVGLLHGTECLPA